MLRDRAAVGRDVAPDDAAGIEAFGDLAPGIVNLRERRGEESACGQTWPESICGSGGSGHAGDLAPGGEGICSLSAIDDSGQAVAAWAAVAGERAVSREETVRKARALEPLHAPLPLAGRLVGMLGPVVRSLVLPVLDARQHLPPGRPVTRACR